MTPFPQTTPYTAAAPGTIRQARLIQQAARKIQLLPAPSVPPAVKTSAGSANTKAVCVTGPNGGSCVTDADTISTLDAVLKKADLQTVSNSGGYGENLTSAAAPDAYTVEYPDGRTLTVTMDGDAVYCTDSSTGETYLASGSAEDFQAVISQFTAG